MLFSVGQHQVQAFSSAPSPSRARHRAASRKSRLQASLDQAGRSNYAPLVKICGLTSLQDAKLAAAAGADFLGMIMWQNAKRAVSASTAKDIACLAADHGIKSVGVFVDESAQQIQSMCEAAGIHVAQLHGLQSRQSLFGLPESLQTIYVMNCDDSGRLQTPTPSQLAEQHDEVLSRHVQWLLVDGQQGGSGKVLPWKQMTEPHCEASQHGWLLAGGLHPGNVADAVAALHPTAVDVSSGVTQSDGMAKDGKKLSAFIAAAKGNR